MLNFLHSFKLSSIKYVRLPKIIPIVRLGDWYNFGFLNDLVLRLLLFLLLIFYSRIRRKVLDVGDIHGYLRFDGLVFLSSIMPDELIVSSDVYYSFIHYAMHLSELMFSFDFNGFAL